MILGQTPTQQNPIDFTPPTPGGGRVPSLPKTGFYSGNIWPFSQVMNRMHAFPAYRPGPPNGVGLQPIPSLSPPPVAAAPLAPAPGPSPSGTAGAFGGSGFGSSGGVRSHSHVDPYTVMRSGMIPGVSPNGSNIRAGWTNAGARVANSMPFQSQALPMAMAPAALPAAPAAMPTTTHGFGGFSWNPVHWFRRSAPRPAFQTMPGSAPGDLRPMAHMAPNQWDMQASAKQQHAAIKAASPNCETIGPRLDGTLVTICNGTIVAISDAAGNFRRVG